METGIMYGLYPDCNVGFHSIRTRLWMIGHRSLPMEDDEIVLPGYSCSSGFCRGLGSGFRLYPKP